MQNSTQSKKIVRVPSKVACTQILDKLADYKDNGGTKQAVKDEIYKLIDNLFEELADDGAGSRGR